MSERAVTPSPPLAGCPTCTVLSLMESSESEFIPFMVCQKAAFLESPQGDKPVSQIVTDNNYPPPDPHTLSSEQSVRATNTDRLFLPSWFST